MHGPIYMGRKLRQPGHQFQSVFLAPCHLFFFLRQEKPSTATLLGAHTVKSRSQTIARKPYMRGNPHQASLERRTRPRRQTACFRWEGVSNMRPQHRSLKPKPLGHPEGQNASYPNSIFPTLTIMGETDLSDSFLQNSNM